MKQKVLNLSKKHILTKKSVLAGTGFRGDLTRIIISELATNNEGNKNKAR